MKEERCWVCPECGKGGFTLYDIRWECDHCLFHYPFTGKIVTRTVTRVVTKRIYSEPDYYYPNPADLPIFGGM